MQNPVPASELANQPYMQCTPPNVEKEICNGLENITISNGVASSSLLNNCNFNTTNWATCYNCPSTAPTVENPTPAPVTGANDPNYRHPVPNDCDSVWWDPVAGQCLCSNSTCAYNDTATPMSANVALKKSITMIGSSVQLTNTETSGAASLSSTLFALSASTLILTTIMIL